MSSRTNSGWIIFAVLLCVAVPSTITAAYGTSKNPKQGQVIKIVAQRYSYTPHEIILKKGESVQLEFTSLDFVHGFKIPDLNIRADLPPGRVTSINLTPMMAGEYAFLCDNFCGSEHEDMNGKITVKE